MVAWYIDGLSDESGSWKSYLQPVSGSMTEVEIIAVVVATPLVALHCAPLSKAVSKVRRGTER
jgi:hypothetical protein